tara:strand:+ start:23 stop:943 length:921 start_codon:yes stop_codon:yes gene_type:complete
MATIADCITRTKRLLNSNTRTELDAIHTGISTTDITIRLKYQTDGIRAGSYISVSNSTTEPETMYVHSRNGEYITVSRSIDGSTANNWVADSVIEVEPRFSGFQIVEAIRDSIKSMPNNLYAVGTTTVSFASTSTQSVTATDMTSTGFYHIISATRTARSSEDRLLNFNIEVQRQIDGTFKVIRKEGIEKAVDVTMRYAHPFDVSTLSLDTRLDTTVGMQTSMIDIPALGAGVALILGEESLRLDLHSQGDSRGDTAVAAGDRARYSLILQAQYDRRVSEEARRLMSLYGVRAGSAGSSVFPTTLR